ncbi:hypothetical protein [Amycolatopsis thailandensis]|uniref:hypothetical protein n=1 Tax=Amycolatopsis thailandensis TaxID=589330 RepID=UPI00362C982E
MEHKKPGRRSKGDRDRHTVRLPKSLSKAVQAKAEKLGMDFNEFVGRLLAAETGVPYDQQEDLQLSA